MLAKRSATAYLGLLLVWGCKDRPELEADSRPTPSDVASSLLASPTPTPAPASSAGLEAIRALQASKLKLSPERVRERRVAFGKGVLGQLTRSGLRVFDSHDFAPIAELPLEQPRLLLTLADGALLAVGIRSSLRFDPSNKGHKSLGKPVLLPGNELRADAIKPDRIWLFEPTPSGPSTRPTLSSVTLGAGTAGVLLPDNSVELESGPGGALGTTREGVWLYFTARRAERLGPGGLRLAGLTLPQLPDLLWALPSRRLDQSYLFDSEGGVTRALVTPSFRKLSGIVLSGSPLTADVGDEGRLLAVVVVAGDGPRFELCLYDADLAELGRVALPADAPTGAEDWASVVTANQAVAVSASARLVAVGGPDRLLVFDAQGRKLFSIPSG